MRLIITFPALYGEITSDKARLYVTQLGRAATAARKTFSATVERNKVVAFDQRLIHIEFMLCAVAAVFAVLGYP